MALISLDNKSTYGFNASIEIDQTWFSYKKPFTTETKTVDGMPDVKWSLKFNPIDPQDSTSFGNFSYMSKGPNNAPKICNSAEWGLRLQNNSEEDFEILAGNKTFGIHKFMVAAESLVFKRMFEDNFKEAAEKKVTITDFKIDIVKAFVEYCYGRDISAFFENESDTIDLLFFADKYDCKTLKPQLENYLASKLSKANVSTFVATADKANALQLRQACIEFVRKILYSDGSFTDE
uniref:BTB domain-containing protein n=1 Tax=Panagrolaimus sp. ES5 TaxID=591445 RepID=A0AC34F252_9BILA